MKCIVHSYCHGPSPPSISRTLSYSKTRNNFWMDEWIFFFLLPIPASDPISSIKGNSIIQFTYNIPVQSKPSHAIQNQTIRLGNLPGMIRFTLKSHAFCLWTLRNSGGFLLRNLGGFVCLINFTTELEFYLGLWHLSPRVLIGMGRLISCTLTPFSCFLPLCVSCVGICLSCQITGSFEARDRTLGLFVFPTVPAINK